MAESRESLQSMRSVRSFGRGVNHFEATQLATSVGEDMANLLSFRG
jgi:hypothetical protein